MQVHMRYYAQVRQATGRETETTQLPDGSDIRGLLAALADRYGAGFRALVLDDKGDPRPGIIVLVNEQAAPRGEKKSLADGDNISIFSPVAGG